ncbi:phage tail protein [Enterobacter mori]|uniref:phage tail-collar fiber domain-containing protein n=1 Tax=Enterobacter mori TaxID=539813 RepID=UPI002016618D|nr:phage tail protein [Enterobacter mori]
MSQAVITKVFIEWKAQQAIDNKPVTLDEFIFAFIPDLDVEKPVDNTETTPPADKIVHRQAVSKSGVVNGDSVVYSVTLGADVGDFDFNWIGLANKATGTLAMIIHAPTQRKVKNASGQQGNVLVRSMLMEYSGAQAATNITTPAETWQIDFTARLASMDERQRLENIDLYGAAAFFDTGYLVSKSGTQYFVTKGAGYVAGLRAELTANQNIAVSTKPVKVWLDVSWAGTLTSVWAVKSKITVAASLSDYAESGVQHYVFALASIDANGNITDLRPAGGLSDQALKAHEKSRNHPDATTSEKGFTKLSSAVDSASESLAATPKAVKAVNDALNDVKKTLGTAASKDVQTSKDDVTAGRVLVNGGALALRTVLAGPGRTVTDFDDLPENAVSFGYDNADNSSGFTGSVLDFSGSNGRYRVQLTAQYNGNGNRIAFRTRNGDAAGAWNAWGEIYHTRNKPNAGDVGALSLTGGAMSKAGQITVSEVGKGMWTSQNTVGAPVFQNIDTAATSEYWPIFKQHYKQGNSTWSAGMLINEGDFHLHYLDSAGGTANFRWVKDGQFIPGSYANFDARYLKQSGGRISGLVEVYSAAPIIQLTESDTGKKYFIVADGNGFRINEDSTGGNFVLSYAGASKQLKTVGQFVPGDWSNFDSRYQAKGSYTPAGQAYTKAESDGRYYTKAQSDAGYMAKTSAYTKAESDARYGVGKTTTGSNNAYYTHGNGTVFMQSVRNITVGNNATVTVTLPTSFPNGILGIGSSYNGPGGNNSASFYNCTPVGKNQVQIATHNCNGTFYLNVTGY